MGHVQREWYWLICLSLFSLERDALTDVLFLILGQIAKIFFL